MLVCDAVTLDSFPADTLRYGLCKKDSPLGALLVDLGEGEAHGLAFRTCSGTASLAISNGFNVPGDAGLGLTGAEAHTAAICGWLKLADANLLAAATTVDSNLFKASVDLIRNAATAAKNVAIAAALSSTKLVGLVKAETAAAVTVEVAEKAASNSEIAAETGAYAAVAAATAAAAASTGVAGGAASYTTAATYATAADTTRAAVTAAIVAAWGATATATKDVDNGHALTRVTAAAIPDANDRSTASAYIAEKVTEVEGIIADAAAVCAAFTSWAAEAALVAAEDASESPKLWD